MKQVEKISKIVAAVQLENVRFTEAKAKTTIRSPEDISGHAHFLIQTSAKVSQHLKKENVFFVLAEIDARLESSESEKEPLATVKAGLELQYKLPKELKVTQKELAIFAGINGIYNAWPYWREFVQSIFLRMGLPPLVLPVYRLKDVAEKSTAAGQRETRRSSTNR